MILAFFRSDHFTKNDLDHEKDHDHLNDLDLLDQRSWSLPISDLRSDFTSKFVASEAAKSVHANAILIVDAGL